MLIEAQRTLPLARLWGMGETSSSDGQHFPSGGAGEAMNLVNARYGTVPGVSFYTHLTDQYGPHHAALIPATAHEAPYLLDGLLLTPSGRRIREHYTDTGGFTDHVFAIGAILGFRFAPCIRDLADKRLYAFTPAAAPPALAPMVAGRVNETLIRSHWPDILRLDASMVAGSVVPSHILRKLAAYPRQNGLAMALREVGRIERTLFILDWLTDRDLQRRAQIGINKGEAHHSLKRALFFNRLGLRDRTRRTRPIASPGSTCSPPPSPTGTRSTSARPSSRSTSRDGGRPPKPLPTSHRSLGNTSPSPANIGGTSPTARIESPNVLSCTQPQTKPFWTWHSRELFRPKAYPSGSGTHMW
jgi:TnpA family transposase